MLCKRCQPCPSTFRCVLSLSHLVSLGDNKKQEPLLLLQHACNPCTKRGSGFSLPLGLCHAHGHQAEVGFLFECWPSNGQIMIHSQPKSVLALPPSGRRLQSMPSPVLNRGLLEMFLSVLWGRKTILLLPIFWRSVDCPWLPQIQRALATGKCVCGLAVVS